MTATALMSTLTMVVMSVLLRFSYRYKATALNNTSTSDYLPDATINNARLPGTGWMRRATTSMTPRSTAASCCNTASGDPGQDASIGLYQLALACHYELHMLHSLPLPLPQTYRVILIGAALCCSCCSRRPHTLPATEVFGGLRHLASLTLA